MLAESFAPVRVLAFPRPNASRQPLSASGGQRSGTLTRIRKKQVEKV